MNKRGSNVDVIISFIIFIGFLVFFYATIQPSMKTQPDKSTEINFLYQELAKSMGSNLTLITVSTNYQGGVQNHLQLVGMIDNLSSLGMPPNIVVTNSTGAIFNSVSSTHDIYVDTSSGAQNQMIFEIYYSPQFSLIPTGTLTGSQNLILNANTNYYTIGPVRNTSSYLLDFDIINLIGEYNNNYNALKSQFNISPVDNFGFNFTYQNLTSIGTSGAPKSSNVYSELFPVTYLYKNSTLQEGNLIVKIW
ncbi:MAG: hypothetical protein WAU65_02425 [Candidatus Nanoarchaeia archaeon]